MLKDFKDFIMKGNVLDLAVAVVIGAAFGVLINAFTKLILMPLIAAIIGGSNPNFDVSSLPIRGSDILWGQFLTALVNFVIVAFALFIIIRSYEKLSNLRKRPEEEAADLELTEVELLTEIRDLLSQR